MRKLLLLLLGLMLLVLLLFFCFNSKATDIKDELVSSTQTAYVNENMSWVNVNIKGEKLGLSRVLALNGTAPSVEMKRKAGLIAANIAGVEGVENNLIVEVAVEPQVVEVVQPKPAPKPEVVEIKEPQEKLKIEVVEVEISDKDPKVELVKVENFVKTAQNCYEEFVSIMSKQSVNFKYNSASITKESYPLLDDITKIAKGCSKAQLIVEGHTDWDGSKKYNKKLSSKRAQAVKMYLISKGVVAERIQSIGYGESKPIASNKTKEGQEKNRRIEFKIKGVN